MAQQATFLKINPADTVVVCLTEKKKGEIIEIGDVKVTLAEDVPAGHKVLLRDVKEGEDIIGTQKCGDLIVQAIQG